MIDFHAHVLPGCDHGSDGLETSLKQLSLARNAGITKLIATPHFYPNREELSEFLSRRERTWNKLLEAHKDETPELLLGAEVSLCGGLDHMKELDKICIQGTRILLVEMQTNYWSNSLEETLQRIQDDSGLCLVLAHVDRYDPSRIERLLGYGMLAQINAEGVTRLFGSQRIKNWIDQGSVVAMGSDIHGVKTGYTDFTRACHKLKDRAQTIFERTEKLLDESRI